MCVCVSVCVWSAEQGCGRMEKECLAGAEIPQVCVCISVWVMSEGNPERKVEMRMCVCVCVSVCVCVCVCVEKDRKMQDGERQYQ